MVGENTIHSRGSLDKIRRSEFIAPEKPGTINHHSAISQWRKRVREEQYRLQGTGSLQQVPKVRPSAVSETEGANE